MTGENHDKLEAQHESEIPQASTAAEAGDDNATT